MNPDPAFLAAPARRPKLDKCLARIQELETRLEESEETLDAIRRGAVDAVVVSNAAAEHRVYTLENADHPYRVLIEQIQEGAVTLGLDGTVLYCNRRLAEMLRMPQERVIGQSLLTFVQPADHPALKRSLKAATKGATRDEIAVRNADGITIPVYLSLSFLLRGDDEPLLCGVLADLTQQKSHHRALCEAKARLVTESAHREEVEEALRQSQKMEAVGQLTGGLAHDFNNLLTGIVGSLQLMRMRAGEGRVAELNRYIDAALATADRAAALTHRLLAFSRRQTLDPKLVDANRLIAGLEDLLRRTVGPTVKVYTTASAELGSILCDPNQLENALLNLVINARDAMPEGGDVTIETANLTLEPTFALARGMAPGNYVSVSVIDTGTGMTAETVARAFDPFFTTKPIGMGTGLGLSMIYGFAKQSGGQVRIHSKPGLGTTVRLYFPRLDGTQPVTAATDTLQLITHAQRGQTVLVVDDEPVVRMLVVDVLEELGYAALTAADGASALQLLEHEERIDLLVSDVGLPGGMDGRQLADAARARRPGLNILFITGFAESAAMADGAMEAGMQLLTKPFAITALAAKIQAMTTTTAPTV